MKAGLDQVLGEQVSDQVQKSVQAADLMVAGSSADLSGPEFGVSWVNPEHQDDAQNSRDDGGGHVVHHGPGAHPPTGASIQTCQTWSTVQTHLKRLTLIPRRY